MKSVNKKNVVLFIIFGLTFIIGPLFFIIPFTSQMPDGLEKVSEHTVGFIKKDDFHTPLKAPMPEYEMPGVKNKFNAHRYAGVIGVLVVFSISIIIGFLLKRRRRGLDQKTG